MARWLFKEEPTNYSYDRLVEDKQAPWNGIANALALKYLRQVKAGDEIFFYHTGKEKAIVGVMRATADAVDGDDVSVKVAPVQPLQHPVTLAVVKADADLKDWELARISRLSIITCLSMLLSPALARRGFSFGALRSAGRRWRLVSEGVHRVPASLRDPQQQRAEARRNEAQQPEQAGEEKKTADRGQARRCDERVPHDVSGPW
jgi:predicted RNA-binding protein with PUA-like domain